TYVFQTLSSKSGAARWRLDISLRACSGVRFPEQTTSPERAKIRFPGVGIVAAGALAARLAGGCQPLQWADVPYPIATRRLQHRRPTPARTRRSVDRGE